MNTLGAKELEQLRTRCAAFAAGDARKTYEPRLIELFEKLAQRRDRGVRGKIWQRVAEFAYSIVSPPARA